NNARGPDTREGPGPPGAARSCRGRPRIGQEHLLRFRHSVGEQLPRTHHVSARFHVALDGAERDQRATAKRRHSPVTPFSWCSPLSTNSMLEPVTRSTSVLDTRTSLGSAFAATRAPMCTATPAIWS